MRFHPVHLIPPSNNKQPSTPADNLIQAAGENCTLLFIQSLNLRRKKKKGIAIHSRSVTVRVQTSLLDQIK